jgi:hypothetical protein
LQVQWFSFSSVLNPNKNKNKNKTIEEDCCLSIFFFKDEEEWLIRPLLVTDCLVAIAKLAMFAWEKKIRKTKNYVTLRPGVYLLLTENRKNVFISVQILGHSFALILLSKRRKSMPDEHVLLLRAPDGFGSDPTAVVSVLATGLVQVNHSFLENSIGSICTSSTSPPAQYLNFVVGRRNSKSAPATCWIF